MTISAPSTLPLHAPAAMVSPAAAVAAAVDAASPEGAAITSPAAAVVLCGQPHPLSGLTTCSRTPGHLATTRHAQGLIEWDHPLLPTSR